MENQKVVYRATSLLSKNAFVRNGWTFVGWNTAADGKGVFYADHAEIKNTADKLDSIMTLYAQWKENAELSWATIDGVRPYYFLDGKNIYENWINIKPFQRQLENLGVHFNSLKDDLNSGKIYATIELKEPQPDFQKKAMLFPPPQTGPNENVQDIPKNKFDDNLSDVSISIVETKEEDREGLELDQFIEYEYIFGSWY